MTARVNNRRVIATVFLWLGWGVAAIVVSVTLNAPVVYWGRFEADQQAAMFGWRQQAEQEEQAFLAQSHQAMQAALAQAIETDHARLSSLIDANKATTARLAELDSRVDTMLSLLDPQTRDAYDLRQTLKEAQRLVGELREARKAP